MLFRSAPFREAEFDILYGEGISREGDLLDLAVEKNLVEKSGTWFSFHGERLGQGRDNARQFLRENTDIRARMEAELRKSLGLPVNGARPAEALQAAPTPSPGATPSKGRVAGR